MKVQLSDESPNFNFVNFSIVNDESHRKKVIGSFF